jgi:hypothetical protein
MKRIEAMSTPAHWLETEKILYRYSSALERGDFAAVARVLELAQADPELEGMLLELNQAYLEAGASASLPEAPTAARPAPAGGFERLRRFFKSVFSGGNRPPAAPRPAAAPRPWAVLGAGALVLLLVAFGAFNIVGGLQRASQANGAFRELLSYAGNRHAPGIEKTVYPLPLVQAPAPTEAPAPTAAPAAIQAPVVRATVNVSGEAYPPPVAGAGGGGPPSQPYPVPQGVAPPGSQHMIVHNGSLTLVAADTRKTRDAIQALVNGMADQGAYVVSSYELNSGDANQPVVQMSLRVPAARFEASMDALAALAQRVDSRNESAQDVTAEYVDLSAQLEQLQAARQRLLEIMKEAKNTSDLLQAESQLTQRETEIASIQGRMKYLQATAQLSSIDVTINPSVLSQPLQPAGWSPAETARLALGRLVGGVQAFTDWIITFAIATLPWLLVAGLIVLGAWRLVVRRSRTGGG